MDVSKAKYEVKTAMTNDLLKAEEYINSLGVETRKPGDDDKFRSIYDVLSDIVTVWNNNPTIGKDEKYKSWGFSDEDCKKYAEVDTKKEVADGVQTFN